MKLYDFAKNPEGGYTSQPLPNTLPFAFGEAVYDKAWEAYSQVLASRQQTPGEKPKPSDLRLALRRRADIVSALFFFIIVVSLFPLGVGPEPVLLRKLAPGVLWVAALLATMLSLPRLFADDHRDGTLEQLALAPQPLALAVIGKVLAHWLVSGLPLALIAPVLGIQFDLSAEALLVLTGAILLGTPALSGIGAIGAALTLGLRGGGVLLSLLVLPLYIPVLILGSGALQAALMGMPATGYLLWLGSLTALAVTLTPFAIAAGLKISVGE